MSSLDLITRYFAERARLGVFIPLAMLLAVASAAPRIASFSGFVDAAAQALVLVLAFRVWDDIEDRRRDAREHPHRVMVVAGRVAPFVALASVLAITGVLPSLLGVRAVSRLAAIGGAAAVLLIWYRTRRERARGLVGGHVVLLKYPAIAYAVAPTAPSFAVLAALYLLLCGYEAFDDPALRASITARRLAITELALVPLIIATASLLGGGLT